MAYTIKQARPVLLSYLGLNEQNANYIQNTDNWGILFEKNGKKYVIFIMPLGENTSSPKIYFDIRDSGAEKFVAAWEYAKQNNYKFFCLGVKDESDRYRDYVISVEADINTVLKVSGLENGRRSGAGTQLNIPSTLIPDGNIVRGKSSKFNIFFSVISKDFLFTYLDVFDNRLFEFIKNENEININTDEISYSQTIYYGVPGSGKSYSIDSKLKELGITEDTKEEQIQRVVFHPEYSNSDFIGQILPSVEGDSINYKFTPGPFTQILKKAYENKSKPYALIIEEINRGNAAAIFGEVFQLLDRFDLEESETVNGVTYTYGWSSYCINNDNMNYYIRKDYNDSDAFISKEKFTSNIGLRLPPNLSLFATMNTSDQNVFKLDNAFKRRWGLQLIKNSFDLTDDLQQKQCNSNIEGFNFTWGEFRRAVNKIIIGDTEENNSFSDKQLGAWFVKNKDGVISSEIFANKVLEYLWDDVFTYEKTKLFNKSINTLEEIIKNINEESYDSIFNENFTQKINEARTEINTMISNVGKKSENPKLLTRVGKRISFNEIGLQKGTTLKMHYGNNDYQCTIEDDKAVSMDNVRYETLTACTRKIMGLTDTQTPGKVSEVWVCNDNGKTLKEMQFGEKE